MTQSDKQGGVVARRKIQISDASDRKKFKRPSKINIVEVTEQETCKVEVKQAVNESANEKQVEVEKPVIEKQVDETPLVVEKPVIEKQVDETPLVVEKPVIEKQVDETPLVVEKPVIEKQVDEIKPKITRFAPEQIVERKVAKRETQKVVTDIIQPVARARDVQRQTRIAAARKAVRPTAKQIKEQEIERAFSMANSVIAQQNQSRKRQPLKLGFRRIALAFACAAVIVAGIVFIVKKNTPDITEIVAAVQSHDIDVVYPKYIPRDFSLSDFTSGNGRATMNFNNPSTNTSFSLIEENASADTKVLKDTYVKSVIGKNYTKVEEGGVIIYIGERESLWVSDGILYRLIIKTGALTKKQITTIATTR